MRLLTLMWASLAVGAVHSAVLETPRKRDIVPAMTQPTTCSTTNGYYVIGGGPDNQILTSLVTGNTWTAQPPTPIDPKHLPPTAFPGGRCLEVGSILVYASSVGVYVRRDAGSAFEFMTLTPTAPPANQPAFTEALLLPEKIALVPDNASGGVRLYVVGAVNIAYWIIPQSGNVIPAGKGVTTLPATVGTGFNVWGTLALSPGTATPQIFQIWLLCVLSGSATLISYTVGGAAGTVQTQSQLTFPQSSDLTLVALGGDPSSAVIARKNGTVFDAFPYQLASTTPPSFTNTSFSTDMAQQDASVGALLKPLFQNDIAMFLNPITFNFLLSTLATPLTINTATGKTGIVANPSPGPGPAPVPGNSVPSHSGSNSTPIIIGGVVAGLAVIGLAAAFFIFRSRKRKGLGWRGLPKKGGSKHLFPTRSQEDTAMTPLGLFYQDRSLPEIPASSIPKYNYNEGQQQYNQERNMSHGSSGRYAIKHGESFGATYTMPESAEIYSGQHSHQMSRDSQLSMNDMLMPNRHSAYQGNQGLTHDISVGATTSHFPRRSVTTGQNVDEAIQLQVVRYEDPDAHKIGPHMPQGASVLGHYTMISEARSARAIKLQHRDPRVSPGVARSGTVMVRRSRLDFGSAASLQNSQSPLLPDGTMSPWSVVSPSQSPPTSSFAALGSTSTILQDSTSAAASGDSSMLLTHVENQNTSEVMSLKWYMTELHWKREAALLKHLRSPIFVMELLATYVIPALQDQSVPTYPFVNAMGGCSSLLSDIEPIKTAQHARSVLRCVSAAVDWCHQKRVVHLNIQPGSFFLEEGIDPAAQDAPWKLWDFTCARFVGEPIGIVGGGGELPTTVTSPVSSGPVSPVDAARPTQAELDLMTGNPLPACYTAPEVLDAWRQGKTIDFPATIEMDTWSLGCLYYEIMTGGHLLFKTEADAWALVGGWNNTEQWTASEFVLPYPLPSSIRQSTPEGKHIDPQPQHQHRSRSPSPLPGTKSESSASNTSRLRLSTQPVSSQELDPSGTIGRLMKGMVAPQPQDRIPFDRIMEQIY